MSTTTSSARSPGPWENVHSRSPSFQHSRTSTTPAGRPSREPGSVGQNLPPISLNASLSPHKQRFPPPSRHTRTPSPNYFGLQVDAAEGSSSSQFARANWSPPSSNVRSAAATSPSVIPLDQNPDFEAFRRQSESAAFSLGRLSDGRRSSSHPTGVSDENQNKASQNQNRGSPNGGRNTFVTDRQGDSTMDEGPPPIQPASRSPKRLLSSDSANITGRPRRNSPASFGDTRDDSKPGAATIPTEAVSRISFPPKEISPAMALSNHRGETLPVSLESNNPGLITPQHLINIMDSAHEEVLLLDIRVSTQYARSRIPGALSLCIPTTLLKRLSFNVQKLAETFKEDTERQKFERWRTSKYIIAYDAASSTLKDAVICVNTLKKFANEGWDGASYILKGGFEEFSKLFPSFIDSQSSGSSAPAKNLKLESRPEIAPVVGGCPMPATKSAANPFFGNIRQNMDLIGGVGQMPINHPKSMTRQGFSELPIWLRQTSDEKNNGKNVSDKFLQIEKREQKRMQEALSGNVEYGSPDGGDTTNKVQIAGIEKGSKNRYNNIWPFEHSRVRLRGVPDGGCDYINANHVQAEWSRKRYIATQGPIPDTFSDFWRVIWDEDIRVLVMLTAEKEGGQIKANRYWDDHQYGPLTLRFLSEHRASVEPSRIHKRAKSTHSSSSSSSNTQRRSTHPLNLAEQASAAAPSVSADEPFVIVRRFSLSHANQPWTPLREITQLQYASWPDFGAPAHPAHLLGLVEQCDAVVRASQQGQEEKSRPVLVHCSAGCGRTGTFCTVDSVVDMLRRQRRWRKDVGRSEGSNSSGSGSSGSVYAGARGQQRQTDPMDVDSQPKHDSFFGADVARLAAREQQSGNWLERDDVDLIEKTVEDFRLQRLSMVQSLRQFVLCYETILEWMVGEQMPRTA